MRQVMFGYRLVYMEQEHHKKAHETQPVEVGKEHAWFRRLFRNSHRLSTCEGAFCLADVYRGRVVFCHAYKNSINAKYTGLLFQVPVV